MGNCLDHLNFTNGTCEDCKLPVDAYGNTEDQFDYCCFPNCGCDGDRLCMAKEGASSDAGKYNVEGMYKQTNRKAIRARMELVGFVLEKEKKTKG